MELVSISWMPHRPSLLLGTPDVTVLLDCALDMDSLGAFLPCSSISPLPIWMEGGKAGSSRYVEHSPPEVCPCLMSSDPKLNGSVDTILISNWMSLLALPCIMEQVQFKGEIYATEPTIQLGRLLMQEMCSMAEQAGATDLSEFGAQEWKSKVNWSAVPGLPSVLAKLATPQWRPFYKREAMEYALAKVTTVYFNDPLRIPGGLVATACSSGYSIGSCNWLIKTCNEKILYMSATSARTSHVKPADWEGLSECDVLIASSLSRHVDSPPENVVVKLATALVDTLKKGGNVLLPIVPAGCMYDLIELVYTCIEKSNVPRDLPIYIISSVGRATLGYASIFAEWLSPERAEKAFLPEEPFPHAELLRSGRVKVYENVWDDFSKEMQTPCVVFAGHPSLRMGSVVHFLDLWGDDAKNSIIMTDPDYSMNQFYGPFKKLRIKAYFFPIDTRLNRVQLQNVLTELAPKMLLAPEAYKQSYHLNEKGYTSIKSSNIVYFEEGQNVGLPFKQSRKRVLIEDEVLKTLEFDVEEADEESEELMEGTLIQVSATLSAYDYELKVVPRPTKGSEEKRVRKGPLFGRLKPDTLVKALAERRIKCDVQSCPPHGNRQIISIKYYNAKITIMDCGRRTRIDCPDPDQRRELRDLVAGCLTTA